MQNPELMKELSRTEGEEILEKNLLILDLSMIFPYGNWKDIAFDFELEGKECPNKTVNHRFPNKTYHTITKTYGKMRSRIGYPVTVEAGDLDKNEQYHTTLKVKFNASGSPIELLFPLKVDFSKGQIANIHMILGLEEPDEPSFTFHSIECYGQREDKSLMIVQRSYAFGSKDGTENNLSFKEVEATPKHIAICEQTIETAATTKENTIISFFSF